LSLSQRDQLIKEGIIVSSTS